MLVLSRKVGERILVGEQVRITVVRVSNGGVRLGIEAPDGVTVIREELTQTMRDARAESGAGRNEQRSATADRGLPDRNAKDGRGGLDVAKVKSHG